MTSYSLTGTVARTRRVRAGDGLGRLPWILAVSDVLVLLAAVLLAWELRLTVDLWAATSPERELATTAGPWIMLVWLAVLAAHRGYSRQILGAGPEEFRAVLLSSALAAGAVGLFCYLFKVELSRGFLLMAFLIGTPLLLLERYVARKVLHRMRADGRLLNRVVAVGAPSGIDELVGVLHRERYAGYEVVGACLPDGTTLRAEPLTVPVLGSVDRVGEVCRELGTRTVLVARGAYSSAAELQQMTWDLEEAGIDLIVVPSLTEVAGPRVRVRPVGGLPLLHVDGPRAEAARGLAKRAFDVVVAAVSLVVAAPLLLAAAVAIKLEDGGPVLFRQSRVGVHGSTFSMLKLRTMVVDAEDRLAEVLHLNECDGALFKVRDDPRVTRVGRWLRRYSLDELPQLLNVLRGEMSLVGPRPPLPSEVETYGDGARRRLLVRPGMTGLWQTSGRSELGWDESVRLDLYYVDNWSMLTDLVIMAKTVKTVLASDGAY